MSTEVHDISRVNVNDAAPRVLGRADAAATRGDALGRVDRVDAPGGLDPVLDNQRDGWRSTVETRPVGSSQWFG